MQSETYTPESLAPGSTAYKKARKQFLKSNRNRPSDDSFGWSPFRVAEKKYKARFPPPDLSEDVLDLALLDDERKDEIDAGVWRGRVDVLDVREVGTKAVLGKRRRRAYRIPQVPGLVLLPGFLSPETQRDLVRWCLSEHARTPNQTNLDTHYDIPEEGVWNLHACSLAEAHHDVNGSDLIYPKESDPAAVPEPPGPRRLVSNTPASPQNFHEVAGQHKPPCAASPNLEPASVSELLPRLRWANIGWFYHWGTKQYDFARGKVEVGEPVKSICRDVVRSVDWSGVFGDDGASAPEARAGWGEAGPDWDGWESSYEPDAGIVNFYQYKDTLMGHVDRSEVCATSPLASLSLGNAAVFLIGGLTRDEKPVAILLRSGDVVMMAGPGCRRAYHGVPRILEGTLPIYLQPMSEDGSDWAAFGRYLQTTRINVNVRQVFPKDFDPSKNNHAGL
ncbi:hypothetical protein M0805_003053 [Coniferiporia weirii]|nr:hypothetical protein M0805_003053 [Coniferiporia weirii]